VGNKSLKPLREGGKEKEYEDWVRKMLSAKDRMELIKIYQGESPLNQSELKAMTDEYDFMKLREQGIDVVVLTDEVGEKEELETKIYDLRGYDIVNNLFSG